MDPMKSLVNAYLQVGGDPDALIQQLNSPQPEPLRAGEVDFFKKLEEEMNG